MPSIAPSQPSKSGYLPSLDGWRAIAVLGVMFTHDYDHHIGAWDLTFLHTYGGYGVRLFFAISGLLITTRILEEEKLRGHFNLRGFYLRRFFRIQPAAFFYLAVAALAVPLGATLDGGWKYWLASLLFYRNYLPHDVGPFSYFAAGHYWTLAVEEHFYLLLSLLLYFVRKNRAAVFGLFAVGAAALPIVLTLKHRIDPATAGRTTQETLWYLVWPAFFAVLLQKPNVHSFVLRHFHPWKFMALIALFFVLINDHQLHHGDFSMGTAVYLFLILFPLFLIGTVVHPGSWTTRVLELSPLRFVGRISYSLYLWHVIFFVSRWGPDASRPNPTPHWFTHAPWNFLPAFVCALLSYYLLERPMMRLGHRLAPPATPGRSDLIEAKTS